MSTQRDNDKLDELIFRTINTEKPHFDAEKWKQKYPDEYQTLISRKDKTASSRRPNIWKVIFDKPAAQVAAAAAAILVVGLLIGRGRQNPVEPAGKSPIISQPPAKIISIASMRMAYQQGGLDALDKQLGDTLDVYGPRSSSVSIQELLEGSTIF
jgi:hypothetical protein